MSETTIIVAEHWEPASGGYRQSLVMSDGVPIALTWAYGNGEGNRDGQWHDVEWSEDTSANLTPVVIPYSELPQWVDVDDAAYQLDQWQVDDSGMQVLQGEALDGGAWYVSTRATDSDVWMTYEVAL